MALACYVFCSTTSRLRSTQLDGLSSSCRFLLCTFESAFESLKHRDHHLPPSLMRHSRVHAENIYLFMPSLRHSQTCSVNTMYAPRTRVQLARRPAAYPRLDFSFSLVFSAAHRLPSPLVLTHSFPWQLSSRDGECRSERRIAHTAFPSRHRAPAHPRPAPAHVLPLRQPAIHGQQERQLARQPRRHEGSGCLGWVWEG